MALQSHAHLQVTEGATLTVGPSTSSFAGGVTIRGGATLVLTGTTAWLDVAASRAAAEAMVAGFPIRSQPARPGLSNHEKGLVIEWDGDLEIVDGNGDTITITSVPWTGANTDLHAVGATYGVFKYLGSENHWSIDGR